MVHMRWVIMNFMLNETILKLRQWFITIISKDFITIRRKANRTTTAASRINAPIHSQLFQKLSQAVCLWMAESLIANRLQQYQIKKRQAFGGSLQLVRLLGAMAVHQRVP